MSLTYQVRPFVKGANIAYEVWQATEEGRTFFGRKLRWEKRAEFDSYTAACQHISEIAGGYYNSFQDFDEQGRPIFYPFH